MKFHEREWTAVCRAFKNGDGDNVLQDFIVEYSPSTGQIHEPLNIPNWCLLPEHKSQINFESKTYTVFEDKLLTSMNDFEVDLPYHKAEDFEDEDVPSASDLLPALVAFSSLSNTTKSSDMPFEDAYDEYSDMLNGGYQAGFTTPNMSKPKKNKVCSSCGGEHESVNRNTNLGMCDGCWKSKHKDQKSKNQANINNFRLKRGAKFISSDFKVLTNV
jgi:hypothetical protein